MTLLEYVTSLQDQGLSDEEVFAKAQEWKKENQPKEKKVEVETIEEVKEPAVAEKDTTVTAETTEVSESVTGSSQQVESNGRTPEQQAQYEKIIAVAKPEEVITKNGYDLKYDNTGVYFYKPEGSDNSSWKTYKDKQGAANLSIASQFGHSDFSLDEYNKTKDTLKQGEELYIGVDGGLNIGKVDQRTLSPEQLELEKQFLEETSLNVEDENRIQKDTNDWFKKSMIPETTTKKRSAKLGGDIEVETGKMIPNPEWEQAEIESKKVWDALDIKPENITEQEWIEKDMKSNYANSLKKEAEKEKLENWIESQEGGFDWKKAVSLFGVGSFASIKDVFDKGDKQKMVEAIQQTRKLNLDDASKNANEFATTAKDTLESLTSQMKLIAEAKYQTPEEAKKGKALLTKLNNKRNEIVKIYEDKVENLNEMMLKPEYKNLNIRLDYLTRNFNPAAIFSENVKVGIANAGVALADFSHMVADAPNAFGVKENPYASKALSIISPLSSLAAKFVKTQPYQETRDEMKSQVSNYVNQTMQGIAHSQSLSDLKDGSDWGRYFSTMLGSQTFNTAVMFGTGGAALPILTAQAVGSSYGEMEKENKKRQALGLETYSPFQMYTVAMGNGVLEYASERISLGIINRSRAAFNAMGPSVRQGFAQQVGSLFTKKGATRAAKATGYYALDLSKEGLSEGGVELGGNLFDRLILGKDVNLFEGVSDATFSGAVMAGGVYKAPALFANISQMVQGPDSNTKIANNRQKIKDLQNTIASNPKMSKANMARLNNQIVDLVKDSGNEINKTLNRFTQMDRSEIDALSDLELSINIKRKAIDEVKADPNFNDKDAEINRIQNEILELDIKKNKILEPYIQADSDIDTSQTVDLTQRVQEGSDVVAEQLGDVGITRFDTTEDIVGAFETLKAQGIQLEVAKNNAGEILDAKDQGYGLIATLPDGTQQVIINNASSKADGVLPADKHEILHAFAAKMDAAKLAKMGIDLKNSLDSNPNIKISAETQSLLNEYEADLKAGKINEATFYEEVMAVTSDALTPDASGNTGITITQPGKLKTFLNNFLETIGWKQSFKDGDQVISFLKGFNKDVMSGKGLSQQTLDTAEVDIDLAKGVNTETEIKKSVAKESKRIEDSQEVQKIYDEQGAAGAMDIIAKFKPITNKIVEARSQAPNFDRQLLTDEIETGKRGILDLVMEYKPESGVPLAAYINKFLPARAIEASKRVLGEEFTTDVTEAKGVITEEAAEPTVKEKPIAKKPTETVEFSQTQIEKIGAKDKVEVETRITEATNEAFKDQDIKTFGKTRNVPKAVADIYASMFGLNPQTITDKTRNYQKTDSEGLTTAKQFLLKNAANDFSRLPETKDGFGKGTFLPRNVMNALYKDGKLTGTLKDYMDLIRQKPTKPIYRDAVGQTIRGLLNLHIRNRMFETLVPTTAERAVGGAKFSKRKANNQINEADLDLNAKQKKTFLNKVKKFVDKGYTLDEAIAIEAAQIGRSKGFAYENVIIRKLKELNIEGFKVSAQAGGNKVGIPDFAAKIFDANFDVEVKLEKAQYSDIGLVSRNQEINFNNRVKKKNYTFTNRIQKELINPAKKAMKAYRKRAGELGADLKLYDKTGKLPSTIYTQLQAEGLQSDVTQTAEFNQDIISEIYENKVPPTSYIQLKNSGLFFMGKNPLGLPIPELTANVNVSLRISRGSRSIVDGVEMFTVNLRVLPDKLTNVPKSNYSLDSRSSMTALMKTEQVQLLKGKEQANTVINNPMLPGFISFSKTQGGNVVTDFLQQADKALNNARKLDPSIKKIRVFDFDDTLARSKSMVIVNMPDGSTKKIDATEFARDAQQLEAEGTTFDFTEFKKVIDGKKGPLFNVAKKIADARGTDDLFILTARPADSANNIKTFLDGLNLNIPLNNITGLGDGTAAAKARWIIGKAAEGYNDFYFADDAIKNVKAVKNALSKIDVKSKVQKAKFSKEQAFNTIINDMIESSSGIESYKKFSAAKAKTIGRDKGRFDFITLASSAEDFKGLLYRLIGDGKKGEAQFEFLKTNLIDPYNRAEDAIVQAKISAANDFMALKEQFKGLPKTLETETGVGKFTYQHALRVYMWTKQDMSIPGLSKADARKLNKFITDDAQLQAFADQLISIQKGKPYPEPSKDWLGGNLTTDIIGGINKVNRAEYQQQWAENVEIIFSPENLNKMEAAYGTRWRNALENSLKRMKAGTNRLGYNDATSAVLDWVNNSVGAVMFLNTRSAVLQTISAVNFINWGDNNIIKAGAAFANQKQFWGDFMTLMNSDYLTQRRNGLKINVSESEIADAVKDSKNKAKAAIAYLLSKGFVFTRYADSFAIASGGATFYRNRIKKYLKEGMSQELAQEKAFNDFRDIAEESQQSSSPDKISMQQASAAGRIILNWANTPMQYVRIQKRALQDLIAGRGDAKVHISRIAYYGVIQNLIFNALQQALFAIGFGDDDEEDEKKKEAKDKKIARVANGMIDSQLKGLGIAGAAMVAAKNTLMKIYEESQKKTPEFEKAAIEALSFSPAISSKYRKIVGGLKSFSWNRKEIKEKGFSLDNPAYLAGAQIVTAFTNIPLDRVVKKINNIRGIMSEQSQAWQKVSMSLGWSAYDVGLPYYGGWDKPKEPTEAERKQQEINVMKRDTNTAEQTQMLLDLGLDKKQIKALRYEEARVKKIIELQNKKKDGK